MGIKSLFPRLRQLKTRAKKHRRLILCFAIILFAAGIYVSLSSLDLDMAAVSVWPLVAAVLVTAPLMAMVNAVEFQLCARAVGKKIRIRQALQVSAGATIANILPFPAGLALRGAALLALGVPAVRAGEVLLLAALLWMAMAATLSGTVLFGGLLQAGVLVLGAGIIAVILWRVALLGGAGLAAAFLVVRGTLLVLLSVQVYLCFMTLGASVELVDAAAYVVANIAALVVSVVPAGLGVVEGTGAVIAVIAGTAPAAAFVALGLSRVAGLTAAGVITLGYLVKPEAEIAGRKEVI